jgi:hypothetical protein
MAAAAAVEAAAAAAEKLALQKVGITLKAVWCNNGHS